MEEVKVEIGVKETKEAILAMVVLGKFVAERLKDGAQLDDALALGTKLIGDAAFKEKVMAGIAGIDKVPAEIKDISMVEAIELAQVLPEILAALKA